MTNKVNKFLYINFLDDKRIYHLNKAFWQKQTVQAVDETTPLTNWIEGRFANGKLRYDGNPIYSTYAPKYQKAVRIIQEKPESKEAQIGAWIQKTQDQAKTEVLELVIALELSTETKQKAVSLIDKWLKQNANLTSMKLALNNI